MSAELRLVRAPVPVRRPALATLAAMLALAFSTWFTFQDTLSYGFLVPSDDELHITENARLLPPSLEGARWFWTHAYAGMYIPVSYDFWMLEAELAGGGERGALLDARVFRVGCIALHAFASILVYFLLQRWLGSRWPAILGALVFELHPLQVESVAWISETRGLLAAMFGVSALLVHASGQSRIRTCVSSGLLALAMLSKPSAAAIPLIALVADRWVLGRSWRASAASLAPWFLLVGALSLVAKRLQPDAILDAFVPWYQRPWIAADATAFYLEKLALPFKLVPDHGRTPARVLASSPLPAIAAASLCVGLLVLRYPGRRGTQAALLLFLAGLTPVLGLVPFAHQEISTVASRFAYLAMIGPALGLALVAEWLSRFRSALICLAPLSLLGATSFGHVDAWRDARTAFERNLELQPESHQAHAVLGTLSVAQGDLEAAYEHYSSALRLGPDPHKAQLELGNVRFLQERLVEAAAHYRKALETAPGYVAAQRNLARAFLALGRWSEAQPPLERLHERDPRDAWAARHLARARWWQGDLRAAARLLESASEVEHGAELALDQAWLLATASDPLVRDPARAVRIAGALGQLTPASECTRTWVLAASRAAEGAREDALALAREAERLAQASGRPELVQRIREWTLQLERGQLPADQPPLPEGPGAD